MSNKAMFGAFINSSGNILSILVGIISFPLLTRLLSANDYGLMSLLNSSIFLCVGVSKFGIQQALVRQWKSDEKSNRITFSTAFYGVLMLSITVSAVALLFLSPYLSKIRSDNFTLLSLAAGIILIESLKSIVINKELAEEKSVRFNIAKLIHKYLSVLVAIALLMTINNGVEDIYRGYYTASVVVFAWLYLSDKKIKASLGLFDAKLLKGMIAFGFPLLIVEIIDAALGFSDRYLMAYFLDFVAVGQYSAVFGFMFNIQSVMISSIGLTIAPVVVRIYNEEGDNGVQTFLDKSLKIYGCIGSAVALGLFAVGPDIFILLASSRYEPAIPLLKPIAAAYFFYGIYIIAAYTLFIHKRTVLAAMIMATAAVVSITGNIILLPKIGVMGAAVSILMAYATLAIIGCWLMWRVRFLMGILALIPHLLPSVVMYGTLYLLPASRDWMSVGYRVLVGCTIWMLICALCYKEARVSLIKILTK
jgi:O-antigen/teichoic acid export membrane protein